jgi:hypothetical protein
MVPDGLGKARAKQQRLLQPPQLVAEPPNFSLRLLFGVSRGVSGCVDLLNPLVKTAHGRFYPILLADEPQLLEKRWTLMPSMILVSARRARQFYSSRQRISHSLRARNTAICKALSPCFAPALPREAPHDARRAYTRPGRTPAMVSVKLQGFRAIDRRMVASRGADGVQTRRGGRARR